MLQLALAICIVIMGSTAWSVTEEDAAESLREQVIPEFRQAIEFHLSTYERLGVEQNFNEAYELLIEACMSLEDNASCSTLSSALLLYRDRFPTHFQKVVGLARTQCDDQGQFFCTLLGDLTASTNHEDAIKAFDRSCESGDGVGCESAVWHLVGIGRGYEALYYFERDCQLRPNTCANYMNDLSRVPFADLIRHRVRELCINEEVAFACWQLGYDYYRQGEEGPAFATWAATCEQGDNSSCLTLAALSQKIGRIAERDEYVKKTCTGEWLAGPYNFPAQACPRLQAGQPLTLEDEQYIESRMPGTRLPASAR